MIVDWIGIILDSPSPDAAWSEIFSSLLSLARGTTSPVVLHDATVTPDRLLAETAWELWEAYPDHARKTSTELIAWTGSKVSSSIGQASEGAPYVPSPHSKAVLILDALSLRSCPFCWEQRPPEASSPFT